MATALINQVPLDFASIETEVVAPGGQSLGLITGLDEFEYTATANRTEMYGSGRLPMTEPTEGDVEYDGSITVLRYWFDWLCEQSEILGIPLFTMTLTISLNYYGKNQAGEPVLKTDTLKGVKLKEIGNSGSRGSDPQMVSLPLRIGNIYFNGKDVLGNSL